MVFQPKLVQKKYGRDRTKGGQLRNKNGQKHGFYSTIFDQRSKPARRMSENHDELIAGLGGVENLSLQEKILIERVVAKTAQCERAEAAMLAGEDKPALEHYLATANSLRLDLQALGLKRRKREVTLATYLKGQAG
jgi:hypothetical protein